MSSAKLRAGLDDANFDAVCWIDTVNTDQHIVLLIKQLGANFKGVSRAVYTNLHFDLSAGKSETLKLQKQKSCHLEGIS
jgi:hypothetical protein